jgi:hypothetical protein
MLAAVIREFGSFFDLVAQEPDPDDDPEVVKARQAIDARTRRLALNAVNVHASTDSLHLTEDDVQRIVADQMALMNVGLWAGLKVGEARERGVLETCCAYMRSIVYPGVEGMLDEDAILRLETTLESYLRIAEEAGWSLTPEGAKHFFMGGVLRSNNVAWARREGFRLPREVNEAMVDAHNHNEGTIDEIRERALVGDFGEIPDLQGRSRTATDQPRTDQPAEPAAEQPQQPIVLDLSLWAKARRAGCKALKLLLGG